MKLSSAKSRRLLIAGAKFGEIYLNAFLQPQPGLELAGLLATGSTRSQQLAHAFGIPLYTAIDQLPDDIEVACVVVRSTVVGGAGTELAQTFLERGIHVIQEHPLHPDDIIHLQQVAEQHGHCYWVNSFYAHPAAARCWIDRARRVRAQLNGETARFAHLTTSRQLLYSSLDLLLQATDATDASIAVVNSDDPTFQLLRIGLPGCQATLQLQTYLDPVDPDLHSLTMHQLTLGWPSGYLSLEASYGPVLWTSALYDPTHRDDSQSLYRSAAMKDSYLDRPTVLTLHTAPADWRLAFEVAGPAGVAHVLHMLCRHLDGDAVPTAFMADYQLALARLWQQTLRCAGPAQERKLPPPRLIDPQILRAGESTARNAE